MKNNFIFFRLIKPFPFVKGFLLLFISLWSSYTFGQSSYIDNTPGATSFTVPFGVTSITVEIWGGGGAGGGSTTNNSGGSGGGSGGYSKRTFTVMPNSTITYTTGTGGTGGTDAKGGNGTVSTITIGATTLTANGGIGGGRNKGAIGTGGTATGGTTNTAGNDGVIGTTTGNKGGDAPAAGGTGGAGGRFDNDGNPGEAPGGGGGGGEADRFFGTTFDANGGNGGNGGIKITFTCPTFSAGSNQTLATCATTATLAATAATAPATGAWTVVSGTGTVTTPTSATSGVTGIVPGTPLVLRWTVTNGRCGSTSSDVTINSPVGPGCLTYCAATGNTDCLSNDYISNVTYNTINNSTTCNAGGYTIFPKSGVQTTSVIKGASYNFSLSVGPGSGNHGAGVWIDFNQNGSFSDAGEFFLVSNAIVPSSITNIPILIPTGAATGDVRMRVRYAYSTTVVSGMSCAMSGTFGETEDYTITVLPAVPITVTSSENLPICRDVSTTLSATSTASPAYSYTWSPASGLNTTTGATVIATPSQTTTYTVTGTNGTSGSVQKITVTVSPTPKNYTIQQTISPSGATACSEDYVKLDVLGMPPMVPFEEKVTPLNNSWTKFGLSDGPPTNNFYAVDIVVSNTVLAGGSASEFQFKRVSNGYNSDWYITPNSGLPANYLPISLDGYSAANLTFKSRFVALNNTFTRNIYMEVSTDAINWDILWSTLDIANNDNIAATPVLNLATYLGSKVYIRFRYSGDSDGLDTWSLDDIKITGTIPPVSWSPNTGLYTDATLTTAYTGGDVTTLYAAPNGSQLYTLSTSISPCSKSTTSTVVHTKKKFTATSGNWSNNNNWFPAGSPISPTYIDDRCVNIPNGKSVVVDVPTAIAKSVTVDAGGKLTIISKQALTVTDAIGNNSGETNFIVENDANLLQVNDAAVNTGSITVKRNAYMKRQDYTYWGSPVQNQNLKAFSPNTLSSRFYTYNESTDLFVSITPESNSFIPGQGYAVRSPNNFPADNLTYQNFYGAFTGVPTNGTSWTDASSVTRNIVFPLKKVGNGYNLIANPYPSNFDFELLKNLNSTKINFLAYFWTNINHNPAMQGTNYPNGGYVSNYATLNGTMGTPATYSYTPQNPNNGAMLTSQTPNQYIKVGQGFIVKSLVNNQDLIFNNSVRKANNSSIFFNNKTADSTAVDRFWIQLTTPLNVVTTAGIGYKQEATNDFELDYDAPLMGLGSDAIFTVLDTQRLGIQGRKYPLNVYDVIPLGTNHYAAGSYTIAVPIAEGIFANGQNIYLKDNQTNTITNLSDGNYTFTANQGLTEGRFEIIYQPGVVLGTGASTKENLIVYREGNDFVVKSSLKKITGLEVYDASGKLIVKTSPNKNEVRLEGNTWLNGIYVLKINQNGEITTKKVMR